jgi:hypothetical protein
VTPEPQTAPTVEADSDDRRKPWVKPRPTGGREKVFAGNGIFCTRPALETMKENA